MKRPPIIELIAYFVSEMSGPGLPHEVQVGRFLQSQSKEVRFLTDEISKSSKSDKLASQQVPRHMRAVSHNPARLPRRLTTARRK